MEITAEQYARIRDSLLAQSANVTLTNLQVLNEILYVAEHRCKWRVLPKRFGRWHIIKLFMANTVLEACVRYPSRQRISEQENMTHTLSSLS